MPKSSVLNLSHNFNYSDYLGYLTPIACFDCVPGDKISHKIHALIRTQPLLAPVMHTVDIDIHAFFSPDRLVWEDSEDFHSGGDDGLAAPVWPHMEFPASTGYAVGSLGDYLGLNTQVVPGAVANKHSALPFRHYNLIYNNYYRDSQLQAEKTIDLTSGLDTTTNRDLLRPCWKRDYFTKCRPEPQLGPEVVIPLTGDAPVAAPGGTTSPLGAYSEVAGETKQLLTFNGNTQVVLGATDSATNNLYADLSAVTGIPVTELREANALQRTLEKNNIFGGRYMEQLMARFGVHPEDFRLQWPEFLGAGHTKIQFSEVIQSAPFTDLDLGVGNMKGHGISIVGSNRYKYRVKEHGWVLVFMIMRPKTQYMQGLHRMFTRETRYDYLLPEFASIGDQAVLNKEIYAAHSDPNGVFGYTPIYEEYRTLPSRVAGEFKTTLDYWHMARKFTSDPALDTTFVTCNPTNRIFPATSSPQVYVDCAHTLHVRRLIPKNPTYRLM